LSKSTPSILLYFGLFAFTSNDLSDCVKVVPDIVIKVDGRDIDEALLKEPSAIIVTPSGIVTKALQESPKTAAQIRGSFCSPFGSLSSVNTGWVKPGFVNSVLRTPEVQMYLPLCTKSGAAAVAEMGASEIAPSVRLDKIIMKDRAFLYEEITRAPNY
jgi:hypothetical protein